MYAGDACAGRCGRDSGAGGVRDVCARLVLRDIFPRVQGKDESAGINSWNSITVSAFPPLRSHGLASRNAAHSRSPRPSSTMPCYRTTSPALRLSRTDNINGGLRARTVFLLTRGAMRRRVTTLAFAQGLRRACSQRIHTYHGNRTPRTDPITMMAQGAAAGLARLPAPATPRRKRIPPGLS